jgi:hypothetical protein
MSEFSANLHLGHSERKGDEGELGIEVLLEGISYYQKQKPNIFLFNLTRCTYITAHNLPWLRTLICT